MAAAMRIMQARWIDATHGLIGAIRLNPQVLFRSRHNNAARAIFDTGSADANWRGQGGSRNVVAIIPTNKRNSNVSKTYRQMMPKGVILRVRGSPTLASFMISFTCVGILTSLLTIQPERRNSV